MTIVGIDARETITAVISPNYQHRLALSFTALHYAARFGFSHQPYHVV